jgi:MATE family multidrug resistance protein
VVSNATVPLLGIVDTAVVGQLGDPVPIGAVGLGAIILSSVYWVFGFLRMGTVGLAAQALGARDGAEVAALLTRVLMIGVGAGLAMILLQVPILAAPCGCRRRAPEVEALVRSYVTIRVFSAPRPSRFTGSPAG